ncbi:MAG: hypothetical protein GY795_49300 [Desulfobacterales bacterium]|nr:hypothetical protein [Desulfobacterales bacterium]
MKLKELIDKNEWTDVKKSLLEAYPDDDVEPEEYEDVYKALSSMTLRETDMRICIEESFDEEYDDEPDISVFGKDGTLNREIKDFEYLSKSGDREYANSEACYSLDLVPWNIWIGMKIDPLLLEKYSETEIIAYCLWEMTFAGFDQDEIRKQADEVCERVMAFDSMPEQERERLILTDEAMREFVKWSGN